MEHFKEYESFVESIKKEIIMKDIEIQMLVEDTVFTSNVTQTLEKSSLLMEELNVNSQVLEKVIKLVQMNLRIWRTSQY